jgi:cytochrome P450
MHSPFSAAPKKPRHAATGEFLWIDPPEHTRYRRLLAGKFTVRRMRRLTTRVERIATDHLDAMDRHGPPVDLVQAYALPIPALTICELLGVPTDSRELFQQHVETFNDLEVTEHERVVAITAILAFLHELVLAKRARPTDDLLGDLATSDLTAKELAGIGTLLLGAGLATHNMIALGTFALLRHPDQLAALRADPGIAGQAVEELLRYLSIAPTAVRAALEDVELDGQLIKAGETVAVSIQVANRDPQRFADPDLLDLSRQATGHLAFGYGVHQCLGQQLARIEIQVGLSALINRFPALRLAVPVDEVPLRPDALLYGVRRLPVTWSHGSG